jgi:hypothetical protein
MLSFLSGYSTARLQPAADCLLAFSLISGVDLHFAARRTAGSASWAPSLQAGAATVSWSAQRAQKYVRMSKPGSEGSIRVRIKRSAAPRAGRPLFTDERVSWAVHGIALFISALFTRMAS